ncbi:MAG: aldose 1-epimerase [Pirellulales bacterium]
MTPTPITISDSQSGACAKILPGIGFNCVSFVVPSAGGPLEVLWTAPEFLAGEGKPSHSGIPILFPFTGRISGTEFEFEGKRFPLSAGDGRGNAIHGFALNRPWRLVEQASDRLVGALQASVDDPAILNHWPADFRITAAYQVSGSTLACDFTVENPDSKPLPFALGTHPYFRLPLGGASAADCRVTVPVEYGWELESLLPTGRTTSPPVVGELSRGMPFGEMKLDNVFGGLTFENHHCTTTIHDPASGRTMTMTFDDQFTTCVVYNPPHREAVCIEPYTTVPDPFRLRAMKIDPHLQVLPPGGLFRTRIEMRIS